MVKIYSWDRCPFCQKVLRAAQEMGLVEGKTYQVVNAAPGTKGRDEVLAIGGKGMVPFIVDGATSMYESDDIIAYLKNHSA